MIKKISNYFVNNQVIGGIIFVGLAWFIYELRSILISLFIAYLLVATFKPLTLALRKRRVPKVLAVALPFLLTFVVVGILVATLAPFFLIQIQALAINFPVYLDRASSVLGVPLASSDFQAIIAAEADSIGKNILVTTSKVFGSIFSVVATLTISFYFLLDHERIENSFVSMFPAHSQNKIKNVLSSVERKLGDWVRGEMLLCLFIGILTFITLSALGIEYALVLAIIAGILEIIPTIGPIISAVPAVIVALSINPPLAIAVIVAYLIIQQVENNFLVPRIMESAVGLPAMVVILSIIIGGSLLGIPGALLAVPFVSMLVVILKSYLSGDEEGSTQTTK